MIDILNIFVKKEVPFEAAFRRLPEEHKTAIINALWYRAEREVDFAKEENERIKHICKMYALELMS